LDEIVKSLSGNKKSRVQEIKDILKARGVKAIDRKGVRVRLLQQLQLKLTPEETRKLGLDV
jgi:hypothetical protein